MNLELIDEVIKNFFTASAITAACIYVMKKLFDTFIASHLENKKQKIKQQAEFENRKRVEIQRWANPLLSTVNGLIGRLNHIINEEGYKELDDDNPQYEYYMPSTLYYFSQYLCWTQILKEEVNYEIFNEKKEEKAFFDSLKEVNHALREYDANEPLEARGNPVYSLQQRQIAEMMMVEQAKRSCINYFNFEKDWKIDGFKNILDPLHSLNNGINPSTKEFQRLVKVLEKLQLLQSQCLNILKGK